MLAAVGPFAILKGLVAPKEPETIVRIYTTNTRQTVIARVSEDVVRRIVRLYRDAGVMCYSGGILFEFAYQRGEIASFVAHLGKIGLNALEISENYVTLADRQRWFRPARDHGCEAVRNG